MSANDKDSKSPRWVSKLFCAMCGQAIEIDQKTAERASSVKCPSCGHETPIKTGT